MAPPPLTPAHAAVSHVWLPGCLHLATTGRMSVAVPQQWRSLVVRLEAYPAGVRRAVVVLSGSEPSFWAGHYGAKFGSPRLTFC